MRCARSVLGFLLAAAPAHGEPAAAYVATRDRGLVRIDRDGGHAQVGPFKHAFGVVALGEEPGALFVQDGFKVWRLADASERIGSLASPGLALYLRGGARGYLLKTVDSDMLTAAILRT